MRILRLFKRSTVPDSISENEIGIFVDDDGILYKKDSDGNVKKLELVDLPTDDPGGSNNLWNDGGFVRIT